MLIHWASLAVVGERVVVGLRLVGGSVVASAAIINGDLQITQVTGIYAHILI